MIGTPTVVRTAPSTLVAETRACAVCPHPLDAHDRISLRFCQATQAHAADSATTRGCVCPSS